MLLVGGLTRVEIVDGGGESLHDGVDLGGNDGLGEPKFGEATIPRGW